MEFELLGWASDRPTLQLNHRRFSYAGKFVPPSTGKAVIRECGAIIAAVSFSPDRTDSTILRIRYLTVRSDRRGEGIGPRLIVDLVELAGNHGYETVRIAVNNPYAYHALYRAGFKYTGVQTGLAELVLEYPGDRSGPAYEAGLDAFSDRTGVDNAAQTFITTKLAEGPPKPLSTSCANPFRD